MVSMKEHIKTLLKLDFLALCTMHTANRVITSFSTSKNMLKPGVGKYYKWKYGDIFYQKIGEGTPIVLLHDVNPAESGYVWFDVVESMSKNHTLYIVDLPGCGRSAKPNTTYTNYFYVLFLSSFIKKVVKRKTDVIADGYSSSIALMVSVLDASLIHQITAINPQSLGNLGRTESRRSRIGKLLLSLPVLGTSLYNIEMSRRNLDYRFTEDYLYNPFRSNNRFIDAFYEGAHYHECAGKYLLASIKGIYLTVNIQKALKKTQAGFTILYGEGVEHSSDIIREYTTLNNNIQAYPVAKTKYLPMMEFPKSFLNAAEKAGVI